MTKFLHLFAGKPSSSDFPAECLINLDKVVSIGAHYDTDRFSRRVWKNSTPYFLEIKWFRQTHKLERLYRFFKSGAELADEMSSLNKQLVFDPDVARPAAIDVTVKNSST